MTTTFSIIIPVYNVENYLERCIQSVLNQSYRDIEIILVDDGSTDSSPKLCDVYEKQDSRIHVIHKKNGGLSDARNAGISVAKGEYILFLDSDDFISSDCLVKLFPFATFGCDILVFDGQCEGRDIRMDHPFECPICEGKDFLLLALRQKNMPMAAWLYGYRRSFMLENNLHFCKGILHEDEQFTPRAFLAAKSVINTGVCAYHYVIRENSITTSRDLRKNARDFLKTSEELEVIYHNLDNKELMLRLIDTLAEKYLSIFQQGKLYQWGREFAPKRQILRLAKLPKTKMKAVLFLFSPRLYWNINAVVKRLK